MITFEPNERNSVVMRRFASLEDSEGGGDGGPRRAQKNDEQAGPLLAKTERRRTRQNMLRLMERESDMKTPRKK